MPPLEPALADARDTAVSIEPHPARICGWGGGPRANVSLLAPQTLESLTAAVSQLPRSTGAIARGMGRSYGDAAQLERGIVVQMTAQKQFELDPKRGTLTARAGATLGELLTELVPRGWVLPVVPGTQHVSVGGAIASDIHGKNHGTAGTFGRHVQALGLLTAAGELLELGRGDELFDATLGGMGLTGVIVWARIELRQVNSGLLSVDTDRAEDLDGVLAALAQPGGQHRVAWLDLLGSACGRGVVTRAEHAASRGEEALERTSATVRARATVPPGWPGTVLRASTARAFNAIRFRGSPRREREKIERFGRHMFPLDGLDAWFRLYGRPGFVQYQLVVPPGQEDVLRRVIELLHHARVPCFLAVLKDMGPASGAPLSFPIAGWTLALDLPRRAPGLARALEQCDELVVAAGGRVYLSKDSRIRPDVLAAMYPELPRWRSARDEADPEGLWRSDLALRTGLVSPPR